MTALSGTSLLSAFSCASTLALYSSSEGTMTTARRDMPSKGRTLRLWAFGYTFVYVVFGVFANSTMHVGRDRVWSFRERIRIVRSIDDQVRSWRGRGGGKKKRKRYKLALSLRRDSSSLVRVWTAKLLKVVVWIREVNRANVPGLGLGVTRRLLQVGSCT